MKMFCIADAETVRGFRLAGISGQVVASAQQAALAIESATLQPDYAIIVLTEKVADSIRSQVDRIRLETQPRLMVEIPGPDGPLPGRKSLRQLAQEAVGIHIEANEN